MVKQKYYSLKNILKENAEYNLLLGERSNGKSYAAKEYCVRRAYENGTCFGYLRRYNMDIKASKVETYFADCPVTSITNGEYSCISVYRGKIYLSNIDENGKTKRGQIIGHTFDLAGAEHYKSLSYQNDSSITDIIFEEFVTSNGYLQNEPRELMQLVSTIARREKIQVWLIGNTVNRTCPYFYEWDLRNIPKQKQGTIEIYKQKTNQINDDGTPLIIKIAVEFCENSGKNSKMFFGKAGESITTGVWETKDYPNISDVENYEIIYSFLLEYQGFNFSVNLCLSDNLFVYVYPNSHKKYERVISKKFSTSYLKSCKLNRNIKAEQKIIELMQLNKICYSDNLTASDFNAVLLDFNIF